MTTQKDPTAEQQIDAHMVGRAETIVSLYNIVDGLASQDEDGYSMTFDDAMQSLEQMPLSVEIVRHVKILLGTGGPADWLDAEIDQDGDLRQLTYHFAPWWDHASRSIPSGHILWRFAELFVQAFEEGHTR